MAHAAVGLILALALIGIALGKGGQWLHLPSSLKDQVWVLFFLNALQFGLSTLCGAPVALLRAFQRFGVENGVSVVTNTIQILLHVAIIFRGFSVLEISWASLVMTGLSLLLYIYLIYRLFPAIKGAIFDKGSLLRLVRFGGWMSFSNLVGAILSNLDKLLLPTQVSSAQVAYYTVPYNLITRLSIIPGAFSAVLLPFFSSLQGTGRQGTSVELNQRVNRFILLIYLPLVCFLFLFSDTFLMLWMGAEFAHEGAVVLRVFSIAIFINGITWSPFALMQAAGRVELIAKFYFIELLVFVPLLWGLMRLSPLMGAASAWLFRVLLDAILIHIAATRIFKLSLKVWLAEVIRPTVGIVGIGLLIRGAWFYLPSQWVSLGSLLLVAGLYGIVALGIAWRWGLRSDERQLALKLIRGLRGERKVWKVF